jgi:hypothetical protein
MSFIVRITELTAEGESAGREPRTGGKFLSEHR